MRVLTPLLLAVCLVPGVESFTGLASARVMRRQRQTGAFATAGRRPPRSGADVMILAAKPTAAAAAVAATPADTRVDPSVVEAALVEEDKNM